MVALAVVGTGVLVVNASTPLQVMWLVVLAAVLVGLRYLRGHRPGDPPDGGGSGGGLRRPPGPRPPTGVM